MQRHAGLPWQQPDFRINLQLGNVRTHTHTHTLLGTHTETHTHTNNKKQNLSLF